MSIRISLLLVLTLAIPVQSMPARAWWFEDDGTSWPVFDFHRYGGDVNRPAATPDRPYFHGDDAVPLGLRWRDLDEAKAEAAEEDAAAAAAIRIQASSSDRHRVTLRRTVRRRSIARRVPRLCVPGRIATTH